MTTVHGQFFSKPNKEYVSTAVFENVKEELGVELDATFVENLMKIMAETYSNNERPKNTTIEDYVSMLNSKVVQKCYEKVKITSEKVDYNKLTQRVAEERDYELKKPEVQKQVYQPHLQLQSQPQPQPEPQLQHQLQPQLQLESQLHVQQTRPNNELVITLDFRKDLIDVKDNSYCLKLQKETIISCIVLKKFMIELCDNVVSEPYIYVDIENIQDEEKVCIIEDKKVIGRMVQQTATVCNKSMYVYDQEDCKIELNNPIKTNHLYFSFYDYNGTKLNLKKLNAKKVIKSPIEIILNT